MRARRARVRRETPRPRRRVSLDFRGTLQRRARRRASRRGDEREPRTRRPRPRVRVLLLPAPPAGVARRAPRRRDFRAPARVPPVLLRRRGRSVPRRASPSSVPRRGSSEGHAGRRASRREGWTLVGRGEEGEAAAGALRAARDAAVAFAARAANDARARVDSDDEGGSSRERKGRGGRNARARVGDRDGGRGKMWA